MHSPIGTRLAAIGLAVAASAALATAPTPAAAAASTVVPNPTTTAVQYCQVTFNVAAQWSTGYILTITITNISSVPVRWRLVLRFSGPTPIVQAWNANYTQSGSVVTAVPIPPYDVLQPGQSVTVGQLIASGGTIVLPAAEVTCTPA